MGAQASFFRIFFFGGAASLKQFGRLDLRPERVAASSSVLFPLFSLGVSFSCAARMSTIEFSSVTLVCFALHFTDLTSACAFLHQEKPLFLTLPSLEPVDLAIIWVPKAANGV
jgi:hypothetical protein